MARSKSGALKHGGSSKSRSKVVELQAKSTNGAIADNIRQIIEELGEDPAREGLLRTPMRSEKALRYLTSGYTTDISQLVNGALFDVKYDELVIVRDIEFFSMCEHHLLPFFGKMHVAYLPDSKVIGLSKIPRIVDVFARRFQIQERLTQQVAETIQELLMRGVEKQHSGAMTSAMLGEFRNNRETRSEFLSLVGHRSTSI
jgi:GTP cyclohydrolase I